MSTYAPKHRRCMRRRHHQWGDVRQTLTGWRVTRCTTCGEVDLV